MSQCYYFGVKCAWCHFQDCRSLWGADADAIHPRMTLLKCHEDLKQHHQNERTILQELHETWRNQGNDTNLRELKTRASKTRTITWDWGRHFAGTYESFVV